MTVTDTLARDNGTLEVNTGTPSVPVWTLVGGINSWSPSPTVNKADTSKFADKGRKTNMSVSTEDSFTFGGFRQVDEATGERDPGQLACELLSRDLGQDSRRLFRHTWAEGTVSTFEATATVTKGGGGNDDPDAWQIELQVSGDITTLEAVQVPDTPTTVVATPGDDEVEITWTNGASVGSLFVVEIFLDGVPFKTVISSEKPVLVQLPADTGYTARVRAQNGAGWSMASTASSSFTVS